MSLSNLFHLIPTISAKGITVVVDSFDCIHAIEADPYDAINEMLELDVETQLVKITATKSNGEPASEKTIPAKLALAHVAYYSVRK